MKKMLMVSTAASAIEQFNMDNIDILKSLGYTVEVATNFKSGSSMPLSLVSEFQNKLELSGVKCHQINFSRKMLDLKAIKNSKDELDKVFKDGNFSFVHVHTPIAASITRSIAKKNHVKCIYTAHGFHFFSGAPLKNWVLFYPVEKRQAKKTNVLITINQEDYTFAKKKLKAEKIEYIPGIGINPNDFLAKNIDKALFRKSLGLNEDNFVLLSVGELNKNKNHEVVIRSLALLDNPNIHYLLCGQGYSLNHLKSIVKELNLESNVHFLGFRSDVSSIYTIVDLFVFPSKREGLPVSVMEAMVNSLPVICSDVRGSRDLIIDNLGGIIAKNNTKEEYSNAIRTLINDSQLRNEMGKYNENKVLEFSRDEVNKIMTKIYKNI